MSNWILLAAVLTMLLAPNILAYARRLGAERDRLMLGHAMRAGDVDVARLSQARLGLALSQAIRVCRACPHVDACMRWYGEEAGRAAAPFCPNAELLSSYAKR